MQHFSSLDGVHILDAWLTIGSFDGIHLGHQEIVRQVVQGAHHADSPAVVLTFFPHPAVILGKRKQALFLTTPQERAEILGEMGVDIVVTHPFDQQVAKISARTFVRRLVDHLGVSNLFVGQNFALGRDREGNVDVLSDLGKEFGYRINAITPVRLHGEVVSSSKIRNTLAKGDIEAASELLGRPYKLTGEVVPGDGRGKLIGVPTANLSMWHERALPKTGVYVCQAYVNGKYWGAVTNVGIRPTFENQPATPMVETHLLGYEQDLYGQIVSLDFFTRLRDEQRFPNVEALVKQINRDIQATKEFFNG